MSASLERRSAVDVALCGSGLLWAWGFLAHFAGPSGFAKGAHPLWMGFSDSAFLVSSLVSYLLVIVLFERFGRGAALSVARAGCVAMTLSAIALAVPTLVGLEMQWLTLPGSVAAGSGMAFCQVSWVLPLSKADMDTLERTVLSWFPLSGAVFFAISASALGFEAADAILTVLLVLLPLISHVGFRRSLDRWGNVAGELSSQHVDSFDAGATKHRLPLMLASLLCVFLFLSFVWLAFTSRRNLSFGLSMLTFFAGTFVLLLLTHLALRRTRRFSLTTFYRWALPLTVVACALASMGSFPLLIVSYTLFTAVYIGFDAIAKLYFIYGAQHYVEHEPLVFGFGSLTICLGGFGGMLLWRMAEGLMTGLDFATTMLITLVPFVCAIAATMGHEPLVNRQKQGVAASESNGATAVLEAGSPQTIQVQCDALAEQHRLTPREREIVTFLAQGRSRSFIRETLYISKGTVDTHAYHAYAKLGIKTRDDLMRLIDEM